MALRLLLQQARIDPNFPDQKGSSPLMHASEENKIPCVKALLKHGVETEAVNNTGGTALSQAAAHGHKIPVNLLLKAGANVNTQDSTGNTPLARAAAAKHDAVVRFLLENGADPDLADEDEETPFEKARDRHLDDVVKVFQEVLKLGFKIYLKEFSLRLGGSTIMPMCRIIEQRHDSTLANPGRWTTTREQPAFVLTSRILYMVRKHKFVIGTLKDDSPGGIDNSWIQISEVSIAHGVAPLFVL